MHYWKNITLTLLYLSLSLGALAQWNQVKRIDLVPDRVATDNLGQVYVVKGGELIKFDAEGKEQLRNSVRLLGDITTLDFKNALKPMVFFKDLSQITFLDNQLANRGDVLRLDALGYAQTVATCSSYNNGLWLFDQVSFELTRLDERMQVTNQSGSLLQILGVELYPVQLIEGNNKLYMIDSEAGIFVFDVFGTYYNTLPFKGVLKADVAMNKLYLLKNTGLSVYDTRLASQAPVRLPVEGIKTFAAHGNYLYIGTGEAFYIFKQELR